eukprot:CAMPEP_0172517212 /NCGR_PEP_ID=MMETSP1066-20121228/282965_1 /TAXON_ID=671091 /ORGANISM="Coscinodiscus wailesii, Strain CCMP2513" /LENGTH=90 /DNA_ID=CAMNT_0013299085 /DNA_START=153 /DNA_END=422 /DNA_ORIENTATION=+
MSGWNNPRDNWGSNRNNNEAGEEIPTRDEDGIPTPDEDGISMQDREGTSIEIKDVDEDEDASNNVNQTIAILTVNQLAISSRMVIAAVTG